MLEKVSLVSFPWVLYQENDTLYPVPCPTKRQPTSQGQVLSFQGHLQVHMNIECVLWTPISLLLQLLNFLFFLNSFSSTLKWGRGVLGCSIRGFFLLHLRKSGLSFRMTKGRACTQNVSPGKGKPGPLGWRVSGSECGSLSSPVHSGPSGSC